MTVFEYENYRQFVLDWVQSQPKRGHGQYKKIAEHCRLSTVFVSQVFGGDRDFSVEQAYDLAEFLKLTDTETKHFLLLLNKARAGTAHYKKFVQTEIDTSRQKARNLKDRLPKEIELSEAAKTTFYSNWIFSAVRLLSSIDGYHSLEAIAEKLGVSRMKVKEVADFLVENGLCVWRDDELHMGPRTTHLEKSSPLLKMRSSAWRVKALEKIDKISDNDLFYTAPMAVSRDAYKQIHDDLIGFITKAVKTASTSESEELVCLNIDWFRV